MDRSLPRLVLAGFAAVVVATLLVASATSSSAFGTHNPAWDGTAEFRDLAGDVASTSIVQNASTYDDRAANGTLAVVLSPERPYDGQSRAVRRFVERGGTVLVAEDVRSNANPLLEAIGASARFDGRLVRDERNHAGSPELVEADVVGTGGLTGAAETVVLNRGTVLDPAGSDVLVQTSRDAYLDEDRDGELDDAETPATRAVASVESVGEGRVIALSDPSVLINAMLDRGDNREFTTAIVADHDRVLVDVSHAGGLPPLVAVVVALSESAALQILVGAVVVILVVGRARIVALPVHVAGWRSNRQGDAPVDTDSIAEDVLRTHPEWDDARVRRVAERAASSDEGTRREGRTRESDGGRVGSSYEGSSGNLTDGRS